MKEAANPFRFSGFFIYSANRLLLRRRQIRAADVRHLRRHADAFAQRGVGVDGLADAHGVGAHGNVKKVLFKVHWNDVVEQKNSCNLLSICLRQRARARMAEDFGQSRSPNRR